MDRQRDLELILRSRAPIVVIETRDEARMLDMLSHISLSRAKDDYVPLFRWTVTDGLQRLDISLEPQLHNAGPTEVLRHIRAVAKPGIYVLLDFHPYLDDPVNVRLLKDICLKFGEAPRHLILVSHEVTLPTELRGNGARFAAATDGFSGAEIEQAVVSALYAAHAQMSALITRHLLQAIRGTPPLSVVMAENIGLLRQWAAGRTVSCD